jgi:hypothetical protein
MSSKLRHVTPFLAPCVCTLISALAINSLFPLGLIGNLPLVDIVQFSFFCIFGSRGRNLKVPRARHFLLKCQGREGARDLRLDIGRLIICPRDFLNGSPFVIFRGPIRIEISYSIPRLAKNVKKQKSPAVWDFSIRRANVGSSLTLA